MSNGQCTWKYGNFGQQIQCDRNDQAVFGRCGSGGNPDCAPNAYHGIECCMLMLG